MRKLVYLLVMILCLAACGGEAEPVFEKVEDEIVEPVTAEPAPVAVWLPDHAAEQTMADGMDGECYVWDECELRVQTMDGGDIRRTLERITGLSAEKLTVMEYEKDGLQMYQTVWSAVSEEGITLGRCLVADDGDYHYCVSLLSPEEVDVADDYAQICASLDLSGEERLK